MKVELDLTKRQIDILCTMLGCRDDKIKTVLKSSFFGSKNSWYYRDLGKCQDKLRKFDAKLKLHERVDAWERRMQYERAHSI